jgi:hypothetical protein
VPGPIEEDVGVTRGGPKAPIEDTPARASGSVRRTSTIDSARPDGPDGDVQVVALARDLRTGKGGEAAVLATERYDAVVGPDRTMRHIEHPDARIQALEGLSTAGGFRARALALVPDEAERLSLLNLLLDDLPGANLVAGYAMQRHANWGQQRLPVEHIAAVSDLCAGWAVGATILDAVEATGIVPTPTSAPVEQDDDDPIGWHERPPLPPGAMRRARRFDVIADGGTVRFDVHFRDSYVDREGVEGAVHEYSVRGRFDPVAGTIVEIDAAAHALPWTECPQALGSAARLVGARASDLRAVVRRDFVGTSTCTHLNDTLRSLADLPALTSSL